MSFHQQPPAQPAKMSDMEDPSCQPGTAVAESVTAITLSGRRSLVAIDFLRGVSALGVVLFHSRVDLWVGFREIRASPGGYSPIDRVLSWLSLPVSQFGYLVMLFFVISGFCIHLPYAGERTALKLRTYVQRRFFRIYPPYAVVVLLGLLVEMAFRAAGQPREGESGITLASLMMVQNYLFHGGQVPSNPSLWSIPVEVELYVAYPLLMRFLRSRNWGMGVGWLITAVFSTFALGIYLAGWNWPDTNFLKFWVIWWSGAWLAERWCGGTVPAWNRYTWIYSVVAIMSLIAGMTWNWDHGFMHIVWGAVSFLVLWWVLGWKETPSRTDSVPSRMVAAVAKIGVFSYSLYLVHFPLLQLMGLGWFQFNGAKPASFMIPVVGSLLCIPVAWFLYRLIEKPSHEWGRKISRR
jgi:peptidoglycan/LPS O-acetylase OafA/YrhL